MRESEESAASIGPVELELPDWSGMDDRSERLTVQSAFEFCEHYALWFPAVARQRLTERPPKCLEEFTL